MSSQPHSPHGHGHDHGAHDHGSHDGLGHAGHDHTAGASERRIGLVALLTGLFMLAELAGGLISGSLALIADAGHMLTDFAGLVLAWFGLRLARRPADWRRSYGYDRFGVLAAFVNGLALFAIAAWIVVEAVQRLGAPSEILGGTMLAVAVAGLGVNVLAFWLLSGGDRDNLNMRAALLHVLGDLLGSVAAIAAALIIIATGWTPVDPLLSVLVAVLILGAAWRIVRDSSHILLEGTPEGIDPRHIGAAITDAMPTVADVHHVHVWSLSQRRRLITLHARVHDMALADTVRAHLRELLKTRFDIDHATIEIEAAADAVGDAACSGSACGDDARRDDRLGGRGTGETAASPPGDRSP